MTPQPVQGSQSSFEGAWCQGGFRETSGDLTPSIGGERAESWGEITDEQAREIPWTAWKIGMCRLCGMSWRRSLRREIWSIWREISIVLPSLGLGFFCLPPIQDSFSFIHVGKTFSKEPTPSLAVSVSLSGMTGVGNWRTWLEQEGSSPQPCLQ